MVILVRFSSPQIKLFEIFIKTSSDILGICMPEELFLVLPSCSPSAAGPTLYLGGRGSLHRWKLWQESQGWACLWVYVILWFCPQISTGPRDVCLSQCILQFCFVPSPSWVLHEIPWKRVMSPRDIKRPCHPQVNLIISSAVFSFPASVEASSFLSSSRPCQRWRQLLGLFSRRRDVHFLDLNSLGFQP